MAQTIGPIESQHRQFHPLAGGHRGNSGGVPPVAAGQNDDDREFTAEDYARLAVAIAHSLKYRRQAREENGNA